MPRSHVATQKVANGCGFIGTDFGHLIIPALLRGRAPPAPVSRVDGADSCEWALSFTVDDVPPRLLQLFWPHIGDRAVVVPEDRGVELRVLDIGADDAACVRFDEQATEEHARALRQVVLERGKATILIG